MASEPMKLPWSYSTYEVLTVVLFIPTLMTFVLELVVGPTTFFGLSVAVFILTCSVPIVVLYALNQFKQGKFPKGAKWINFNITDRTPPERVHRYLLGAIFLQPLLSAQIAISAFQSLGFDWIILIEIVATAIGIGYSLSGHWGPGPPHNSFVIPQLPDEPEPPLNPLVLLIIGIIGLSLILFISSSFLN